MPATTTPSSPATRAFESALRSSGLDPVVRNSPGAHDSDYWNGNWREYLGFYARALNNCRVSTRTTGSREPVRRTPAGEDRESAGAQGSGSP